MPARDAVGGSDVDIMHMRCLEIPSEWHLKIAGETHEGAGTPADTVAPNSRRPRCLLATKHNLLSPTVNRHTKTLRQMPTQPSPKVRAR